MSLFFDQKDPLIGELEQSYRATILEIKKLKNHLTRKKTISLRELRKTEERLANDLTHPIRTKLQLNKYSFYSKKCFAMSYLDWALYSKTVGTGKTLTSLKLETYPLFKPNLPNSRVHKKAFRQLCKKLNLENSIIEEMIESHQFSNSKIKKKFDLVKRLKAELDVKNGIPTRESIYILYKKLFPASPFLKKHVDIVVTDTSMYFCIPDIKQIHEDPWYKKQSAEKKDKIDSHIKSVKQFEFQQFDNFPVFSFFDPRDASSKFLKQLQGELKFSSVNMIQLLRTVIMCQLSANIELYLIHDTWGHIWQAELTNASANYQRLGYMQLPLAPERLVSVGDDVYSFVDIVYVHSDGRLSYNKDLAAAFIQALLREKMEAIFFPLVAEVCADITEYLFRMDHSSRPDLLPSSSLFADSPAKADFAWTDFRYFISKLAKPHLVYLESDIYRQHFVDRLYDFLFVRYPNNARHLTKGNTVKKQLDGFLIRFIEQYDGERKAHLNSDINLTGLNKKIKVNSFFQAYMNLLRIQFVVNKVFHKNFAGSHKHLSQYREVIIIFLLKFVETDATKNFWHLDETLSSMVIPMIQLISDLEKSS